MTTFQGNNGDSTVEQRFSANWAKTIQEILYAVMTIEELFGVTTAASVAVDS